ncbi:MAG: Mth938-like domain-containing protein [Proteobacteria bacterium]|nr:Mth938-like domain-containing protein [Pseudomonadota bacterium]
MKKTRQHNISPKQKSPKGDAQTHLSLSPIISQYDPAGFVIDNIRFNGSVAIILNKFHPNAKKGAKKGEGEMYSITPHPSKTIGEADLTFFSNLAPHPHVVLIGVGEALTHPHYALRARLQKLHLTGEIVPTAAACRTWNLLLSEGRLLGMLAIPPASP